MSKKIRAFIFSDGHGKLENLAAVKDEIAASDLVLFAGDFTQFSKPQTGEPYVKALAAYAKPTFSVLGNCDYPELFRLTKDNAFSVDGCVKKCDELYITGSGGGSKFTGTTPYERSDAELASDLTAAETKLNAGEIPASCLIVITHNPPFDTKLDKVPMAHVGSKSLRAFTEKYEPLLHISGHIHESVGIDKIGKTVLLNPGSLADGRYAICELAENGKGFEVTEIKLLRLPD